MTRKNACHLCGCDVLQCECDKTEQDAAPRKPRRTDVDPFSNKGNPAMRVLLRTSSNRLEQAADFMEAIVDTAPSRKDMREAYDHIRAAQGLLHEAMAKACK